PKNALNRPDQRRRTVSGASGHREYDHLARPTALAPREIVISRLRPAGHIEGVWRKTINDENSLRFRRWQAGEQPRPVDETQLIPHPAPSSQGLAHHLIDIRRQLVLLQNPCQLRLHHFLTRRVRSEERRVGKECR